MNQPYHHVSGRIASSYNKWENMDPAKRMRHTAMFMALLLLILMGILFILVQTGTVKMASLSAFAKSLTGKTQVKQSAPGGH